MSRENVEIVRRAYDAVTRRPKPDFATVNALYHPDHVLVAGISNVDGSSFRGAQGFREWLANMNEAFGSVETRIDAVQEIDSDRVLVDAVFSARGRAGGVPIERRTGQVVTVNQGRLMRTEVCPSHEQALEALGLSERDAQADS